MCIRARVCVFVCVCACVCVLTLEPKATNMLAQDPITLEVWLPSGV